VDGRGHEWPRRESPRGGPGRSVDRELRAQGLGGRVVEEGSEVRVSAEAAGIAVPRALDDRERIALPAGGDEGPGEVKRQLSVLGGVLRRAPKDAHGFSRSLGAEEGATEVEADPRR
jgi:hypothetical protein